MPNWAEGVLKIRGTRQDIKEFLTNGLSPAPYIHQSVALAMGKETEKPGVSIQEDEWGFNMASSSNGFHISGSQRAFIEGDIRWYFEDRHQEVLTLDAFKSAWAVDAHAFAEISRQFNIDIKSYTFEMGLQFNQDIEIHKGEIAKDQEILFDDYDWECLMPHLGG